MTCFFSERQPLGVQFSHNLRWSFEMVYWCFTALPKALWQLCLWFMPVSLQYPTLGKNLGKTLKKLAKTWENQKTVKKLAETKKTLEKPAKTLENQKKWKKQKNNQYIYIHISRLFGGGGSLPRLSENCFSGFFLVFQGFFLSFWFFKVFAGFSNVFLVLVTFSHLHLFVHWPFGVFMRSSLQEPIV